jgi:hypothetical protein
MNNQPKLFWSTLRRKRPRQLPDVTDNELYEHYFRLNGTAPDTTQPFDAEISDLLNVHNEALSNNNEPILDTVITRDEVNTAILQLKPGKAPGIDRLIPELFIHGRDILIP